MVNFYKRQQRIRTFYYNSLSRLYKKMIIEAGGVEDPILLARIVEEISRTPVYGQYVNHLATNVINKVNIENAKDWREAVFKSRRPNDFYKHLMKNMQGPIGAVIQSKVEENAGLIIRLPSIFSQKASKMAEEAYLKGSPRGQLKKDILNMYSDLSESQAQLIARTETSKASTTLTQARSQAIGIDWYTWRGAEDARERESHDLMNDVLCKFSEPPNPEKLNKEKRDYGSYNAGEIFNCRCYPEPVIDFGDINFPAKVHYQGRIVRMRKAEFLQIAA